MKNFKVNFKLQSVSTKTKPILIVLSLQTRDKSGKYLSVSKSTGKSILPSEWNFKKGFPNDIELLTQLLKVAHEVEMQFEEHQSMTDEDIISIYSTGYFQEKLKEIIDRTLYKQFSEIKKIIAEAREGELTNVGTEREKIKSKIKNLNYKIVNSEGYEIDLDKFFSTLDFYPEETTKKNILNEIKPTVRLNINYSNTDYPIPFYQYVIEVAKKKIARDELKEEGMIDYKTKLAARFKDYDENITLGQMTDDISADFLSYLRNEYPDWSNNYYNNHKKLLKAVLRFAIVEDKFKLPLVSTESAVYAQSKEKVSLPYLTEEMLDVIYNLEFDRENRHLEYTRDIFYLSSYTGGLTFGDLKQAFNIQERKVDGHTVKFIRIARNKTGINAEIPLMDKVYSILEKYNFTFKEITNQQYNRNIKDVCKLAGFVDDFVQTRKNIQNKEQKTVVTPFYELISSHTARRSFCTNFYYHRNMPPALIMEFSQHKELDSFLSYVMASAKVKFDEFSRKIVISERESEKNKES